MARKRDVKLKFKTSCIGDDLYQVTIDCDDGELTPVIDFVVSGEQLLKLFLELGQVVKTKRDHTVSVGFTDAEFVEHE